jgi:hypothetical protein
VKERTYSITRRSGFSRELLPLLRTSDCRSDVSRELSTVCCHRTSHADSRMWERRESRLPALPQVEVTRTRIRASLGVDAGDSLRLKPLLQERLSSLRIAKSARLTSLLQMLLCVSLWVLVALPASAETRAWLDRDRIGAGETATLNIETDQASARAPDYAPLYADFEVTANTSSRQFENINGVARTRVLFAVALRPLRDGTLAIPSLRVDGERTQPLTLTVSGAAPTPARAGSTVFIEAEADAQRPYVQQAVGYTVRLYYAASLISGQLDQDAPQGASLQRVGEDLQYQRELAGRRYTVVERRYLLVPERSGEITIPGARFRGQGVGGFFDDLFGDGRRDLSTQGAPRVLSVRPVPANASQPWLPLRNLALRYVSTPQSSRAGESAEVTIELEADGAGATQLPDLALPPVQGAQVFPEPPQEEERFEQGRPRVRIVRRFSLVAERAGTLRIPGPSMAWWDVGAGAARTASLPDLAMTVTPGSGGTPDDASAPARDAATPAQRWIEVPFVQGAVHPWSLATVIFALLWLATLWWALHRRPRAAPAPSREAGRTSAAPPASTHDLKRALERGDLSEVSTALRHATTPALPDLDAVHDRLDDDAQRSAVRALQQARWGGADAAAALAALRDAFRRGPRWRAPARSGKPLLPPLYPE